MNPDVKPPKPLDADCTNSTNGITSAIRAIRANGATCSTGAPPSPPNTSAHWVTEPERSNAWALRLMTNIALRCGRPFARTVLHLIALYFVLFAPRPRRASARYLARVFGRPARWIEVYRHVYSFAATVLDRVYLLRHATSWLDLRATGTEHVDACLAAGRGAFLMGAHIGSFEALRATGRDNPDLRIAMVMYPDNARLINAALAAIAPGEVPAIIALGRPDSMLAVLDHLATGGLIGVLADRAMPGESQTRSAPVRLPFLGSDAVFSDGPFRLAELLRQRIVFMVGLYLGGPIYDVRFEPLADFTERLRDPLAREQRIQAAMRAYVSRLEALCREQPYNWFNFHDYWHDDA